MNEKTLKEPKSKFEARKNKKYEIKAIINTVVYDKEAVNNQISGLYYLILWKSYLEEKNNSKSLTVVMHLRKLIRTFYKEHLEKSTAIFLTLNLTLSMAGSTVLKNL